MTRTGGTGGLCPGAAGDAAALVELMQQLKEQSGLTLRQLEQRAAERGELLARSTLADVLRRGTLPKEELLAAFVRANGGTAEEVEQWVVVRRRIEEGAVGAVAGSAAADHRPHRKRALMIGAAVLVALLIAVGVPLLVGGGDAGQPEAVAAAPLPTGEVHIRPLREPGLCLTDGRVLRAHAYHTVAMQRPCAQAVPPHTHLTSAGAGRHRIQWTHRDHGKGCLVLLREEGVAGLLEPWNDCTAGGPAQLFRIEAVAGGAGAGRTAYRLRLTGGGGDGGGQRDGDGGDGGDGGGQGGGDRCVTLGGSAPDTPALVRPCSGADDQKFLIGPV